jgi:RP/EB family microtubule-associated protein
VNGIRKAMILLPTTLNLPFDFFCTFGFSFVVMANASRTDLLAWLNELLQINYTKVEQCGTGGAYCQVLDSIYGKDHRVVVSHCPCLFIDFVRFWNRLQLGDLPMSRVKMNAKHEYEFIANYKVMQNVFKAKKIDKVRLSFICSLPS